MSLPEIGNYSLPPTRVHENGQLWRIWQVVVPPSITPEQLCEPSLWAQAAKKLRPLDVLDVISDDGRMAAQLRVISASPGIGATVMPIAGMYLTEQGKPSPSAHNSTGARVRYEGPQRKYSVQRSDGTVLKEGFDSEDQAHQYLASYLRATEAA